jgi:hypothetical protein
MENRAAVFTAHPQAVEVYQSGAWWPGELLGWRHDPDGNCQVWVRVELGGIEESAWTDLTGLRLPEPQSAAAAPAGVPDLAETASLPLVRDGFAAPDRAAPGSAARPGGRRRAPDTGPLAATPGIAAAASSPARITGASSGRHRAPADPGRHRAADTGILPAVAAAPRGTDVPLPRPARADESLVPSVRERWTALDPEPEMLTRPMRLSDLAPHSRRPRRDGSLAGV